MNRFDLDYFEHLRLNRVLALNPETAHHSAELKVDSSVKGGLGVKGEGVLALPLNAQSA